MYCWQPFHAKKQHQLFRYLFSSCIQTIIVASMSKSHQLCDADNMSTTKWQWQDGNGYMQWHLNIDSEFVISILCVSLFPEDGQEVHLVNRAAKLVFLTRAVCKMQCVWFVTTVSLPQKTSLHCMFLIQRPCFISNFWQHAARREQLTDWLH